MKPYWKFLISQIIARGILAAIAILKKIGSAELIIENKRTGAKG